MCPGCNPLQPHPDNHGPVVRRLYGAVGGIKTSAALCALPSDGVICRSQRLGAESRFAEGERPGMISDVWTFG